MHCALLIFANNYFIKCITQFSFVACSTRCMKSQRAHMYFHYHTTLCIKIKLVICYSLFWLSQQIGVRCSLQVTYVHSKNMSISTYVSCTVHTFHTAYSIQLIQPHKKLSNGSLKMYMFFFLFSLFNRNNGRTATFHMLHKIAMLCQNSE